jgi:hypothetical protein
MFVAGFWPLEISAAPGRNWWFQGRFIMALRLQARKGLSVGGSEGREGVLEVK